MAGEGVFSKGAIVHIQHKGKDEGRSQGLQRGLFAGAHSESGDEVAPAFLLEAGSGKQISDLSASLLQRPVMGLGMGMGMVRANRRSFMMLQLVSPILA